MAKKKTQTPTGFEEILGGIYGNRDQMEEVTNIDEIESDKGSVVEDEEDDTPAEDSNAEDNVQEHNNSSKEDDDDVPEEVLNNIKNNQLEDDSDDNDTDEVTDEALIEAQQVGALFDAVGESLGWNMSDITEDERPLTVDDLTKYLTDVVNQNSIPEYADDRIRQLDDYVKNGGNFEDFYSKQQHALSLDSLDMEDEANQKAVVRELLQRSGYTDEQINSKINRYLDADMLVEESEDALSRLKEIQNAELEQQVLAQQQEAARAEAESKAFFTSISKDINSLTDIRGIHIPKEDRKALFDYIFKVDANGQSQYQKDFAKNLSKNLIESAYFTMKADSLISSAKKDGETSAAEKLRKMLRHSAKNHSTYNINEKQKTVMDLASGLF